MTLLPALRKPWLRVQQDQTIPAPKEEVAHRPPTSNQRSSVACLQTRTCRKCPDSVRGAHSWYARFRLPPLLTSHLLLCRAPEPESQHSQRDASRGGSSIHEPIALLSVGLTVAARRAPSVSCNRFGRRNWGS